MFEKRIGIRYWSERRIIIGESKNTDDVNGGGTKSMFDLIIWKRSKETRVEEARVNNKDTTKQTKTCSLKQD